MTHRIKTNLNTRAKSFDVEGPKVRAMLEQIAATHGASGLIALDASGARAFVLIKFSGGAALRDTVDALDRGGFID
jgi:hypothetical protein